MHKPLLPALLLAAVPLATTAQDCTTGRYHTPGLFPVAPVISAVPFGSNTAVAGGEQTLYLDVYQPASDTLTDRPVMVVAFGGSFVGGTRQQVASICQAFAAMGYVAVAPDYRVGLFWPTETTTTLAVMRGAHDMKACVRFLRKSVAEDGNPYGIDPERIIIGGVSAGAISAIHATYLDQESEVPASVAAIVAQQGGVEGSSGSPGYSSKPLACYSFSGAIGDTLWIEPGDVPLASIHETGDGVVPYYTEEVSVVGIPTGLVASGSHDIHVRCDHIGLDNCLKTYATSGHTDYLQNDGTNAIGFVAQYAARLVCGMDFGCEELATSIAMTPPTAPGLHPNPATDRVRLDMPAAGVVELYDMNGRRALRAHVAAGDQWIDLHGMAPGVYLLRVEGAPAGRLVVMRPE